MARFFVTPEELAMPELTLSGENAAHAKVLRLKAGDSVTLCDGCGREADCTVSDLSAEGLSLSVGPVVSSRSEAPVRVSVYIGYPKADKLEHVIQKATELGAFEIVAFPCTRCVSRPDAKSLVKKQERWQKIAASAAEQSRRGWIPQVVTLGSYAEALSRAAQADLPLLFYENERAATLHGALSAGPFSTVSLMTGPEGGFEPSEITQAQDAGLQACTLGSRILRCETAPLCALSAVMYHIGEF